MSDVFCSMEVNYNSFLKTITSSSSFRVQRKQTCVMYDTLTLLSIIANVIFNNNDTL